MLACAMTGSGKTAAFLLPILAPADRAAARHHARARPHADARARGADRRAARSDSPSTRRSPPPRSSAASEWVRRSTRFRSGVDVIIATPGRLLDHFKRRTRSSTSIEFLVLDEADRMLDMGFLPDIKRILKHLPTKRQTLFFSATMPAPIVALTREMLHNPATINLERQSDARRSASRRPCIRFRRSSSRRCSLELLKRGDMQRRTRVHAHEAPREPPGRVSRRSTGSRPSGFTATARRPSARRRSRDSRAASTGCSSRPTSPRAASTSRHSATS